MRSKSGSTCCSIRCCSEQSAAARLPSHHWVERPPRGLFGLVTGLRQYQLRLFTGFEARDGIADQQFVDSLFDAGEEISFTRDHESESHSVAPHPAGTADTVHVIVAVLG